VTLVNMSYLSALEMSVMLCEVLYKSTGFTCLSEQPELTSSLLLLTNIQCFVILHETFLVY